MPWSDVPTVLKKIFGYFGEDQHESRVLRKFVGLWDRIRDNITVEGKKEKKYLEKMDKLREELR